MDIIPTFKCDYVKPKRNYEYVPPASKEELVRLTRDGMTIKDAAQKLDIKYSAAKSIVKIDRRMLMGIN